jgi:hypothetical protein
MKTSSRSVVLGLLLAASMTTAAFAANAGNFSRRDQAEFYIYFKDWSTEAVSIPNVTLPTFPGATPNPGAPPGNPVYVTSTLNFQWDSAPLFGFGGGYNFSEHWMIRGDMAFGSPDYEMTWNNARITGESWINTGKINLDFNLLKNRPFTPYISGGIGYLYVDTGIPSGPPEYSYWWDYYWGPVLVGYQPTYQKTYFTYNAEAGFRWDVGDRYCMRASYATSWVDAKRGTIATHELTFSFSWKY